MSNVGVLIKHYIRRRLKEQSSKKNKSLMALFPMNKETDCQEQILDSLSKGTLLLAQFAGSHSIQQCQDIAFSCASISIAAGRMDSGYCKDGGAVRQGDKKDYSYPYKQRLGRTKFLPVTKMPKGTFEIWRQQYARIVAHDGVSWCCCPRYMTARCRKDQGCRGLPLGAHRRASQFCVLT